MEDGKYKLCELTKEFREIALCQTETALIIFYDGIVNLTKEDIVYDAENLSWIIKDGDLNFEM